MDKGISKVCWNMEDGSGELVMPVNKLRTAWRAGIVTHFFGGCLIYMIIELMEHLMVISQILLKGLFIPPVTWTYIKCNFLARNAVLSVKYWPFIVSDKYIVVHIKAVSPAEENIHCVFLIEIPSILPKL